MIELTNSPPRPTGIVDDDHLAESLGRRGMAAKKLSDILGSGIHEIQAGRGDGKSTGLAFARRVSAPRKDRLLGSLQSLFVSSREEKVRIVAQNKGKGRSDGFAESLRGSRYQDERFFVLFERHDVASERDLFART